MHSAAMRFPVTSKTTRSSKTFSKHTFSNSNSHLQSLSRRLFLLIAPKDLYFHLSLSSVSQLFLRLRQIFAKFLPKLGTNFFCFRSSKSPSRFSPYCLRTYFEHSTFSQHNIPRTTWHLLHTLSDIRLPLLQNFFDNSFRSSKSR